MKKIAQKSTNHAALHTLITRLAESLGISEVTPTPAPAESTGLMSGLRERVKQGAYRKTSNGNLACGDEVSLILGALDPHEVIEACLLVLNIENTYTHLNVGQQSMCLRNKIRGMIKRREASIKTLRTAVKSVVDSRKKAA